MNTARLARPSFLRAARLVLLAALSAGTLGLSGCGGGVSVGVGIGIDAGSHDAPPTVSMSMSTASGAGGTTVRLSASPWDDYAVTQVDFEMVYPGGAVQHLGSVRRPPWVLDISLPYGTGGSVLSLRARAWDDAGQSGLSGWSGISVY
jgi:hypothetical protein